MAKGNSTFNISLKLLDQNFKKGISGIQKQIRGLGNFIKGAFAIGSITAFGRQMIQVATDFEDAMARVKAVSNASATDLQMMTEEARKMGATTRYTATEAAGALENLTRNGMSASQATQALSGTMKFAQANAIGLAESADIVSNTLNMFGLNAKETTRVSDVLSSVASTTATNVSEIYAALVNAAPAAKALGISLEETSAAIGALAQRGVKAEQAGTALRTALTKMVDPKIVDKMKEMGVEIDEQIIKQEGLIGVVKRLGDANLSTADLVKIFSQRGAIGIRQLIDAYDDLVLEMEITKNSAGTTARMFKQGVGTTRAAVDTLKSTYEAFLESLGSKSNVVFNGVLGLFTKLIKNFDTLGGTLLNIASVVVPLMTKKVVTMFATLSTATKKAIAESLSLKVAMGDWIALAATAVTWLVTGFVASMSKVNKEIKDLNKQINTADIEADRLRVRVDTLVKSLGTTTDKKTLAGVVSQLTALFPDFKQQIMETAAEAGRTGNYIKLRGLLADIVELSIKARQIKLFDDLKMKQIERISELLRNGGINAGSQAGYAAGKSAAQYLEDELTEALQKTQQLSRSAAKEQARSIMDAIAVTLIESANEYSAANEIQQLVRGILNITDRNVQALIGRVAREALNNDIVRAAREQEQRRNSVVQEQIDLETKTNNRFSKMAETVETETTNVGNDIKKAGKTLEEQIDDVKKSFNKSRAQLEDDKMWGINGVTTWGDYAQKVYEIWVKAYNDLRNLTGKSGAENPYFEGMQAAQAALSHPESYNPKATSKILQAGDLNRFSGQNRVTNTGKQKGPSGLKTDRPDDYKADWKDYAIYTDEAIALTGTFTNSLSSLQSAFDTLSSSNSTWIDKLAAAQRVLETMEDAIIGVVKIIGDLGDTELLAAKKEAIASALSRKNKKKDIAADTTKAVTGAAASQASIPYIGPILAVAAVAGILALIAASSQKFAGGGIVQGNTKYGDKLLARVNAGEAILNQRQQKRLLDIADGKAGNGGQQVQFFISGKDLVGVIRNNNAAASRISGSKGM